MSAVAGWKARVRVPGTALAFTNEVATDTLGTRINYQITNSAKRVFDPQATVAVQTSPDGVTWTTALASTYTLFRLSGTAVFGVANVAGTQVRFSAGQYLPLSTVAGAKAWTAVITATQLDASNFDDVNAAAGFLGAKVTDQYDATGTLTQLDQRDTFFANSLINATVIVLELMANRNAAVPDVVVWALLDKEQLAVAMGALNTTTLDWTGTKDADGHVVSM